MSKKFGIILLNILPFAVFVSLYKFGGNVGLFMPLPQLLITVVNTVYAGSKKELLLYNGILLISSAAGIYVDGQLYFKYINFDVEGAAVMEVEMLAAAVLIIIFTVIEFLIRYFHEREENRDR